MPSAPRDLSIVYSQVLAEVDRCNRIMGAEGLAGKVHVTYHNQPGTPPVALWPDGRICVDLERLHGLAPAQVRHSVAEQMASVALKREHMIREINWRDGPRPKMDAYKGVRWEHWFRRFD